MPNRPYSWRAAAATTSTLAKCRCCTAVHVRRRSRRLAGQHETDPCSKPRWRRRETSNPTDCPDFPARICFRRVARRQLPSALALMSAQRVGLNVNAYRCRAFWACCTITNRHLLFWGTILLMLGISYAVHVLIERSSSPILKRIANHAIDQGVRHLSRLRKRMSGGRRQARWQGAWSRWNHLGGPVIDVGRNAGAGAGAGSGSTTQDPSEARGWETSLDESEDGVPARHDALDGRDFSAGVVLERKRAGAPD